MRSALGEFMLFLHRRFGPVVRFSRRVVYLFGVDANRFVVANTHLFRWRDTYEGWLGMHGPAGLIVSDGAEYRRRRRLAAAAMHAQPAAAHLAMVAERADRMIASWGSGARVDVYADMRDVLRSCALHTALGAESSTRSATLGADLQLMVDLIDQSPDSVSWHRRLRTPQWRRAAGARAALDDTFYRQIAVSRNSPDADADHLIALLIRHSDRALTDEEIRDLVVNAVMGYQTTSAAMAWAIYALLTTPGAWDAAAKEVRDVIGDGPPGPHDLARLTYLRGVVNETLRLYPPVIALARRAVEDFDYGRRRIRRGTMVMVSPYVTHRLGELWPEPMTFRPQRWCAPGGSERSSAIHEYLPFSSGPHRCIGADMATTELMVVLARLLARTTLHLPRQRLRPANLPAMRPARGLRVDVTARDMPPMQGQASRPSR